MAYEDVASNYESLCDHQKRITALEKVVKDLIICKDILWDKEREREQKRC